MQLPAELSRIIASAFQHAPAGMLICEGSDHVVVAGNDVGLAMVGEGVLGQPYRVGMANLDGQGLYEMFDETFRTGQTLTAERWRVVREPGAPTTENFYTFSTAAWRLPGGAVGGVLITAVDVTKDVLADALQSQRYGAALDVVGELQRNLLPNGLPILPELRLAAHYQAAGAEMQAGGDWFDVIQIDEDHVAFVVGDVVGHGPAAAAAMARLSPVLNAALSVGTSLRTAVDHLDQFAAQIPTTRAATVAVAILETTTGHLEYAARGHAAPLVCETNGCITPLVSEPAAPLGVGGGHTRSTVVHLPAGAILLMYSDGLWERPNSTGRVDQEHLVASARAASNASSRSFPSPVDRVCQFTLEFQARTGFSDDVTLLGAMRLGAPVEPLLVDKPASVGELDSIHTSVVQWLERLGASPSEIGDLGLAVYEAAANVALHAYGTQARGRVLLTGNLCRDGAVRLEVRDNGRWRMRSGASGNGRGLAIIRAVADHVAFERSDRGTAVVMTRRIAHPAVIGTIQIATVVETTLAPLNIARGDGPWPTLAVSGPIDVNTTAELGRAVNSLGCGGTRPVEMDLTDVTFLSSAGVQLLYELSGEMLRLSAAPDSTAAHVLELNALSHLLANGC